MHTSVLLTGATGTGKSVVAEALHDEFVAALKGGKVGLNFRYRYEFVDQDSAGPADPGAPTCAARIDDFGG